MAASMLLVAGCGDDGDDASTTTTTVAPPTTTTTTSPPTTTTEPPTPEQEVEEAYWEAVAVLDDVLKAPDPDDERLEAVMADPLLAHVVGYLGGLQDEGVGTRWINDSPPPREILAIETSGDSATIKVCEIDNPLTIDIATGAVLDDTVLSAIVDVTVTHLNDRWVVTDSVSTAEWNDGRGCER